MICYAVVGRRSPHQTGRGRAAASSRRALRESAEALDGLSQALHFQGEYDWAIELNERAFTAYRRRGKRVEATELARWLAFLHVSVHGSTAAANGWMARAESLLEGVEECAAHGWLTLDRAPFSGDRRSGSGSPRRRLPSPGGSATRDLEFDALALLGEAYVASGRMVEGMTLLDQAMAAVSAGEVVGHGAVGESTADC